MTLTQSAFYLGTNELAALSGSINYAVPKGGATGSISASTRDVLYNKSIYDSQSAIAWNVSGSVIDVDVASLFLFGTQVYYDVGGDLAVNLVDGTARLVFYDMPNNFDQLYFQGIAAYDVSHGMIKSVGLTSTWENTLIFQSASHHDTQTFDIAPPPAAVLYTVTTISYSANMTLSIHTSGVYSSFSIADQVCFATTVADALNLPNVAVRVLAMPTIQTYSQVRRRRLLQGSTVVQFSVTQTFFTSAPISASTLTNYFRTSVNGLTSSVMSGRFQSTLRENSILDASIGLASVSSESVKVPETFTTHVTYYASPPPSSIPTVRPTFQPSTLSPSSVPTPTPSMPTFTPTRTPTSPTQVPTYAPTAPTTHPTFTPTAPTVSPTTVPSFSPSCYPSPIPTAPTNSPTTYPTAPTALPSPMPTSPTYSPTSVPTTPTTSPTPQPSIVPSTQPTATPLLLPTAAQPVTIPTVPSTVMPTIKTFSPSPTVTSKSNPQSQASLSSSISTGTAAGIAVGAIVVIVSLVALALYKAGFLSTRSAKDGNDGEGNGGDITMNPMDTGKNKRIGAQFEASSNAISPVSPSPSYSSSAFQQPADSVHDYASDVVHASVNPLRATTRDNRINGAP